MASSTSGNSSGVSSTQQMMILQNSGSDGELRNLIDQRKRKRMESNRESARRSRMRKQRHLDDLTAQVNQLRKENGQILTNINITTQHYLNVEAQNSVLRAQMAELSQRLESLTEIMNYINNNDGGGGGGGGVFDTAEPAAADHNCSFMNPWNNNMLYVMNQPIMATADMLQY